MQVKIVLVRERGCVIVFSKPARPGRVKTRLVGDLSPEQTAQLHQAFLEDLLERLAGSEHEVRLAWALDDGEAVPAGALTSFRQQGEDLGARLCDALARAGRDHRWCAAVGSDHPELPVARIDEAFERLAAGAEVVLGPAGDGGYYLVAVRREALDPRLFSGIAWSTSGVLRATLERCRELGRAVELLPLGHDVDTPDDIPRLAAYLARHPAACPRTRDLFARWGLGA
jgi:rSAM/selenodomain-associated transferase 1